MRHLSKRTSQSALVSAAAAAAVLTVTPVTQAVTSNWTGPAGGVYSEPTRWDNGIPNAIGDVAVIPNVVSAARNILLDDGAGGPFNVTLGAVQMTNTSTTNANVVGLGLPGTLTFDNTTGPATITVDGSGTASTSTARTNIGATMVFTDTVELTVNNSNPGTAGGFLLGGIVSGGSGGFTKKGSGTMTWANSVGLQDLFKDYTGATRLQDGRSRMSQDGVPRFTSSFIIEGEGQVEIIAAGNFSPGSGNQLVPGGGSSGSTPISINGKGPSAGPAAAFPGAIRPGTNFAVIFDNPISLPGTVTGPNPTGTALIHSQGSATGSITFNGQISGVGKLEMTATNSDANLGTYVLPNSANNYSGGTIINGGTLNATAGSLGTGPLTVNNAITAGGAQTTVNLGANSATVGSLSGAKVNAGNSSTINNNGNTFTVNQAAAGTYDGVIAGTGGLTLGASSTAKLTLTGNVSYTGATTVNGGTLAITEGFKNGNALTVANGATAVVPESTPNTYTPPTIVPSGSNATASKVNALSIGATGTLDLGNNDMAVDYVDPATPLDTIRALLTSGYNGGGWDGFGIISNTVNANNPNQLDPATFSLGYAENGALPVPYGNLEAQGGPLFGDQDVDLSTVLIKFTWTGDLNLDGFIDFQDLSVFNTNYDNGATGGRYWFEGDFNYDGFIDFQDLSLFNTNYDPSKPSLPEPSGLTALGVLGLGLVRRRRRNA